MAFAVAVVLGQLTAWGAAQAGPQGLLAWRGLALLAEEADGPTLSTFLFPMTLIVLLFYLMIVRPENAKQKERQALTDGLQKNDRVLTTGGMIGVVTNVKETTVTLRIDDSRGVTAEFAKSAVSQVLKRTGKGEEDASKADAKDGKAEGKDGK